MPHFSLKAPAWPILGELRDYARFLYGYLRRRGYVWFAKFETLKDVVVDLLYKRRGKYTRPFLHFGTIGLAFLVITFGPIILQERRREESESAAAPILDSAFAYGGDLNTVESEQVRSFRGGEVTIHTVQDGETVSSIAEKYGLNPSTILWENELGAKDKLKPGQQLRILPTDGVRHKVVRGETIYTLSKKYGLGDDPADAQPIVNYPFNEFRNDETFELAAGQVIMIPNGVQPNEESSVPRPSFANRLTPDAGSVTASGSFVWPASGRITQGFSFYHKAFDIANRAGGPILAADSGTVIVAGWPDNSGYGNRVMLDHGNGYVTLYGHMSLIQVQVGQRVARGSVIGQMGSTGRSTGTHLHFEIRNGGVQENPGNYLK
jgi:murein DD-endopeptidase MepM/ murein hydrolase activator NlpD